MAQTTLTATNGTSDTVLLYLTVDNAVGNVTISDFPKLKPVQYNNYSGFTALDANGSYTFTSPQGTNLIGSVSFTKVSTPEADATTLQFSLNTAQEEELDINASNVNAIISVALTGGGQWAVSNEPPGTYASSISNDQAPYYNSGTGVYPSYLTRNEAYGGGTVAATVTKLLP